MDEPRSPGKDDGQSTAARPDLQNNVFLCDASSHNSGGIWVSEEVLAEALFGSGLDQDGVLDL